MISSCFLSENIGLVDVAGNAYAYKVASSAQHCHIGMIKNQNW
jgi:hypothetical protein